MKRTATHLLKHRGRIDLAGGFVRSGLLLISVVLSLLCALPAAADSLAARFGARCRVIVGDGLLAENYPAIHAVGRGAASNRRPRLVDLTWGDEAWAHWSQSAHVVLTQ